LVRRLLAFARRQKLEPAAIDIATLADSVSELLTHTLGGLVELKWRKPDDVWCAFADQAQLELALMNLILNARDSMPGGGTIRIGAENRQATSDEIPGLPAGRYVVLTVIDSGTGIAPALMDKVLEPFFTTKEVGKGSGLGLSMVYGFAKQSNGAFVLRSEEGRGTTAELWLPRAPDGVAATRTRGLKRTKGRTEPSLRILLVDDHEEVRSTTAGMLEDLGHSVIESPNGLKALDELKNGASECDLLITDYAMPHLSGTELMRGARELSADLPIVIITGYADASAIGDRPEDVVVLAKPFSLDDLSIAILAAVREAHAGRTQGTH